MTVGNTLRARSRSVRANGATPTGAVNAGAALGFTARGVTYLVIGVLALAIAAGNASTPQADRTGALQLVAGQHYGRVLLWLLVAGFAAMALWRFAQVAAWARRPGSHRGDQAKSFLRGVAYAVFCYGTLRYVSEDRLPASTNQQSQDFTTRAMAHGGGRVLVVFVGLVIAVAGLSMIRTGVTRSFLKELKTSRMSHSTREGVTWLGVVGNVARGLVFGALGGYLIEAAVTFDPAKAKGIDATLRSFTHTAAGPWLLAAVAAGLALFGVYSFCEARWHQGL